MKNGVRRGLALWGIVFKGMVGVALEYVARGMVGCRSGRGVGAYGRSWGVAVLAIVMGVLLVPVQAGTLSLRVLLVAVVAGGQAGVIRSWGGRAGVH